jgi:hypothetical protein
MRYLEVNADSVVVNIVVWDGVAAYEPAGVSLVACDDAPGVSYGWRKVDGQWIPPQLYPSWTWDGSEWVAPVPQPDGDFYWDEDAQAWVKVDSGDQ